MDQIFLNNNRPQQDLLPFAYSEIKPLLGSWGYSLVCLCKSAVKNLLRAFAHRKAVISLIFSFILMGGASIMAQQFPSQPQSGMKKSAVIEAQKLLPRGDLGMGGFTNQSYPPPVKLAHLEANYQARWAAQIAAIHTSAYDGFQEPLTFYGKIIDQMGQPVIGAKVTFNILTLTSISNLITKIAYPSPTNASYITQSDPNGDFQFKSIHGQGEGIVPQNAGYEFKGNGNGNWLPDNKTSPTNRIIFRMWKLKGAEPMIQFGISVQIPLDGTVIPYNLEEGHRERNGFNDLIISLIRTPINTNLGKHFDWSAAISIPTGGFIECNDFYPNVAPADGYKPTIFIDMPMSATNWSGGFTRDYYFKSRNGKDYGRLTLDINAGYQPQMGLFDVSGYINPNSSRNLEYDPGKIAKP